MQKIKRKTYFWGVSVVFFGVFFVLLVEARVVVVEFGGRFFVHLKVVEALEGRQRGADVIELVVLVVRVGQVEVGDVDGR